MEENSKPRRRWFLSILSLFILVLFIFIAATNTHLLWQVIGKSSLHIENSTEKSITKIKVEAILQSGATDTLTFDAIPADQSATKDFYSRDVQLLRMSYNIETQTFIYERGHHLVAGENLILKIGRNGTVTARRIH